MTGDFYECPKCGWRARLSDVDIRTRCSCGRMVQLPAATAPNPRAWAVARELAAEAGLGWGRWAIGFDAVANTYKPVPAPWDAAAYLADCARRGVEPGPLPSLEYGRCGDPVWWAVHDDDDGVSVTIGTGFRNGWMLRAGKLHTSDISIPIEEAVARVTLATAAAKAMVP